MGHDKEETAKGHGRQDTAKGHGRQDTAKGHGRQDAAKTDDAEGDKDKRAAAVVRLDQIARNFETYEDFLDSQVTEMDMFYIEDRSIARTIKELGFHGNAEKITREQFNEKKSVIKKSEEFKLGAKYLYTDRDVFLLELARREDANLSVRQILLLNQRPFKRKFSKKNNLEINSASLPLIDWLNIHWMCVFWQAFDRLINWLFVWCMCVLGSAPSIDWLIDYLLCACYYTWSIDRNLSVIQVKFQSCSLHKIDFTIYFRNYKKNSLKMEK